MFGLRFIDNAGWITAEISWRLLQHFVDFIDSIGAEENTRLVGNTAYLGNKIYYFRIEHKKLGYTVQNIETLYIQFLQKRGIYAA